MNVLISKLPNINKIPKLIKILYLPGSVWNSKSTIFLRNVLISKPKFKVYPSAYANGYAVQVCKGDIKGLDGKKQCSGAYC